MYMNNYYLLVKRSLIFLLILSCIDPSKPEYNYIDGLINIDAFAATEVGVSYVVIQRSRVSDGRSNNVKIENAQVLFVNSITGEHVSLKWEGNDYRPPATFKVLVGETWQVEIVLPDGGTYVSSPETVLPTVPIKNVEMYYDTNLVYQESNDDFVPGHELQVNFDDPLEEKNFYMWRFRSYERLKFCSYCENSISRDGECVPPPSEKIGRLKRYYDYYCDSNCWQIRRNENIRIFSDEFSNGLSLTNVSAAQVLLYTKENILVDLQQYSISEEAYKYYNIIQDIIENNGSLNAPPPAAFMGNFRNSKEEEYVLGRFTAAAATTYQIFINREEIKESPLETFHPVLLEECSEVCGTCEVSGEECDCCVCSPCQMTSAPCKETSSRTGIKPEGWID